MTFGINYSVIILKMKVTIVCCALVLVFAVIDAKPRLPTTQSGKSILNEDHLTICGASGGVRKYSVTSLSCLIGIGCL